MYPERHYDGRNYSATGKVRTPAKSNLTCIKRRLAILGIRGLTRRLDERRRVPSSRGLTRITPLTVPNPPTSTLIYASVVSAFFFTRYRLDELPRQLVSQSVGRSARWLLPSVYRGIFYPPCACVTIDRRHRLTPATSRVRVVRGV